MPAIATCQDVRWTTLACICIVAVSVRIMFFDRMPDFGIQQQALDDGQLASATLGNNQASQREPGSGTSIVQRQASDPVLPAAAFVAGTNRITNSEAVTQSSASGTVMQQRTPEQIAAAWASTTTTTISTTRSAATTKTPAAAQPIRRDCTLDNLTKLLNSFNHWDGLGSPSSQAHRAFFDYLTPYMLAEPAGVTFEAVQALRPPPPEIDCAKPRYSGAFTGKRRKTPRRIIDVVPVGAALNLLELRLLEGADAVDLFVVSESEVSQKPARANSTKPLFFNLAKNQPRFARFKPQILHIMRLTDPDFLKMKKLAGDWAMEVRIRGFPVACLSAIVFANVSEQCLGISGSGSTVASSSAKGRRLEETLENLGACGYSTDVQKERRAIGPWGIPSVMDSIIAEREDALVLQNDEDELISRETLWHLKYCELRNTGVKLAPLVIHRFNSNWLQVTYPQGRCLNGPGVKATPGAAELNEFLWTNGVTVSRLRDVACVRRKYALETDGHTYQRAIQWCRDTDLDSLGVLSGHHLTWPAEPVALWFKGYSILEADLRSSFPPALIAAGVRRQLSPAHLVSLLEEWMCKEIRTSRMGYHHISELSKDSQLLMQAALPWALTAAPERYCFVVPGASGLIERLFTPELLRKCSSHRSRF